MAIVSSVAEVLAVVTTASTPKCKPMSVINFVLPDNVPQVAVDLAAPESRPPPHSDGIPTPATLRIVVCSGSSVDIGLALFHLSWSHVNGSPNGLRLSPILPKPKAVSMTP